MPPRQHTCDQANRRPKRPTLACGQTTPTCGHNKLWLQVDSWYPYPAATAAMTPDNVILMNVFSHPTVVLKFTLHPT